MKTLLKPIILVASIVILTLFYVVSFQTNTPNISEESLSKEAQSWMYKMMESPETLSFHTNNPNAKEVLYSYAEAN